MKLLDVKRKYSNNIDLGEFLRQNYTEVEDLNAEELKEMLNDYPDNADLGGKARMLND
jgi:hypothetical protein